MDLTKAFDYVNHNILLHKLEAYGVRGNVLALLKSYLSDRQQCTQISRICPKTYIETDYSSDFSDVLQGVPQGSVLGPLLFIIYINDLPNFVDHDMVLFADDSTVMFSDKNKNDLELNINYTLGTIIQWLTYNNLLINLDKTNIMTFRNRKNKLQQIDIKFNGCKINEVETAKFLGLHIYSGLNRKFQVESICTKLSQFSYALYMLGKVVNRSAVITAYHGYVESLLRYGVIFWGNSVDKDIAFKAQKKCVRAICKLTPTESGKPVFISLNLLTLPCIYIYEVAIFVRLHNSMFDHLKSKRHGMKICFPSNKTAQFSNSIFCMAPRIYNHLPLDILRCSNIGTFKFKLKQLLINKAYYNVND